jgi:hypothetical protein
MAGGATTSLDPCDVPLGVKPVGKRTIPGNSELSVFDILNIFHHQWFLSVDHLRANTLLAQKAESRKLFWVEFSAFRSGPVPVFDVIIEEPEPRPVYSFLSLVQN